MSKVTKMKVMQSDGNFSEEIDLGAKASNVVLNEGTDLETKIAEIDSSIDDLNNAGYITKDVNNLTNYTTTESLERDYTKKSEFTGYKTTTDNRLDSVEAKISSVYTPKGSVDTYSDLASQEASASAGDVWNVVDTGKNYAWTGSEWDDLGGTVDLSNYYTRDQTYSKDEVNSQIEGVVAGDLKGYVKTTDAEATYAKQADLVNYETTDHASKTYATKGEIPNLNEYMTTVAADAKYLDKETAKTTYATKEEIPTEKDYLKMGVEGRIEDFNDLKYFSPGLYTNNRGYPASKPKNAPSIFNTWESGVLIVLLQGHEEQEAAPACYRMQIYIDNSINIFSRKVWSYESFFGNEIINPSFGEWEQIYPKTFVEKATNEADALSKSQSNPNVLYYWTD